MPQYSTTFRTVTISSRHAQSVTLCVGANEQANVWVTLSCQMRYARTHKHTHVCKRTARWMPVEGGAGGGTDGHTRVRVRMASRQG